DFSLLSKTERKGIIKEILCDGITTDNGIEEWLITNYNHELKALAKEVEYKDEKIKEVEYKDEKIKHYTGK
ncbi:MAG: hypothetical protein U9R34_04625, partial [Nanoarchaeota archaeon]|nr:hypothetical protein [Nanoarchaeota archaeon]